MFKRKHRCFFFVTVLFLSACANVVAPTGGAKDTTPPKVVAAKPENHGTGFNGRKIEITFDEYVTLNNASQQVLVSPPLSAKPDIKLNGKTVSIKFKEDLKPNATYTINFGEAIKDLHEGNVFKEFTYTFATGETLDSLNLRGKIFNADDKKPAPDFFVGLYAADSCQHDSVFFQPMLRVPDYIAKSDKEGAFRFIGLPHRRFLVFAIEDMNSNRYFDLPNEKVAFLDTLVVPNDSLNLTLYAFSEVDTTQMLLESKLVEEGLLRFVFRWPADSISVTATDSLPEGFRMVEVWSNAHDTLCWYFTPKVKDSLHVAIRSEFDTLINKDLRFSLHYKGSKPKNARDAQLLKVSNNLKNNLLLPEHDLLLRFSEPVTEIHDTLRFVQTDACGMEYRLDTTFSDTENYEFKLADSVFFSVRGRTNKAFTLKFKRATDTDLGAIIIKVCPPAGCQVVVQLLDSKGTVVDRQIVAPTQGTSATVAEFHQLSPGKYKLQAIIDIDRNGRWSTGDFHHRHLPEAIIPYGDELDLKAGWDIAPDENWDLR